MSISNDENDLLVKAEAIVEHLAGGGTLKTIADINEKELEAIYAVAYNHFTARKYDKAIDLFKFLCLYDHTEPRWFYSLGVTRQRKGEYAEAIEAFAAATLLDALDPRPQVQAGYCLMAMGRWPEALSALEGAIITCGVGPEYNGLRSQAEAMLATVQGNIKTEDTP